MDKAISIDWIHRPLVARFLRSTFSRRPNIDAALCSLFLKDRLCLPPISPALLFEDFHDTLVTFSDLPRGTWSTPLNDIAMILKVALCSDAKRILEVGSFRGYTALALAKNLAEDARIVTVDAYPDHGEAYRDTPWANRIDRRVGVMGPDIFTPEERGSYDLIFLDANHFYEGVKADTEVLLEFLKPHGFLLWHDYANWGVLNAHNGVPEYLHNLARRIPIGHIVGTDIAIHSPGWTFSKREAFENAIAGEGRSRPGTDPWKSDTLR